MPDGDLGVPVCHFENVGNTIHTRCVWKHGRRILQSFVWQLLQHFGGVELCFENLRTAYDITIFVHGTCQTPFERAFAGSNWTAVGAGVGNGVRAGVLHRQDAG